ncbi:MAG TPA: hypothetical protein VF173_15550 [Thermoanaerobaculia bacterium]|nr:hypothetical protein [Thermoanaerobaculia bacterium]
MKNGQGPSRSRLTFILGLTLLFGILGSALAQPYPPRSVGAIQLDSDEEKEGSPIERERFWAARRGGIPYKAIVEARRQADRLLPEGRLPRRDGRSADAKALIPGGSWTSFGPRPISASGAWYAGRVTSIAVDPVVPSTVYAGGANGGVWKSTDSGSSWTPMAGESSLATLAIGSIAVDPTNHNVVYAGTGEPNGSDSQGGQGIFKSTNAGGSWTLIASDTFTPSSTTSRILVGPTGTVWMASSLGLFFSNDGGTTWKRRKPVHGFANGVVSDVAMSPDGNLLYASVLSVGLFRSNDGGTSWVQLTSGLPAAASWSRSRIAIAPSNPQVAYVIINPITNSSFFTANGGASWTLLNTSIPNSNTQGGYNMEIAVDPLNANVVYVGAVGLSVNTSGTGGGGWTNVSNDIHVDQHALAFPPCSASPCSYYSGNDGGVWFLRPQGSPTSVIADNKNFNLVITEFTGGDAGINFVTDPRAIAGSQDNGTEVYVRDDPNKSNPSEWTFTLGADGGYAYLDHNPATPNFAYAEQQSSFGLFKSDFWGYTWFLFNQGISGLPVAFYPFYTPDRLDNQHFAYAANSGVYEIIANLGNWYRSSQDLGGTPSALAIAPSNSAVIYAGLSGGRVYRTAAAHANGAQSTWALRNGSLPAGLFVNSLAVDTNNQDLVYLAGATFAGTPQAVYKSTNGGQTWTNISGNLPAAIPAYSIVTYFAGATRVLVVGTDIGVYFSTNEGVSWTSLNQGLPRTRISQLAIDRDQTTLIAFTGGRGAFSMNIGG